MAQNFNKIALCYVRVSTQEQVNGYSIGEQIDRLRKYCDAHDWIVVNVYTDAGYSGGNTDRPALQQLIKDVKSGIGDCVIVYKLDRLSRSQKDTLQLIEDTFLRNNCDFVSLSENFDTATPFGRAMIGILAVFAQLEREQIKERMTMGLEARVKGGKWKGGVKPKGYDYVDGNLIINEYEAMQIREIFDLFISGESIHSIVNLCYKKGYVTQGLNPQGIKYILKNKTYAGYVKYGKNYYQGSHEPIVSIDTFVKANEMLSSNADRYFNGFKNGTEPKSLLGGLLYCKQCGSKYCKQMTGSKRYGYHLNYICYSRSKKRRDLVKDPNCKNKIYRMEDLDKIILDEIRKIAIDPDALQDAMNQSKQSDNTGKAEIIQAEIKNIDAKISRFMDLYGNGRYSIKQLDEKVIPLDQQRTRLQAELITLTDTEKLTVCEAKNVLSTFSDIIDTNDLESIKRLVNLLINKIEIDNDDLYIYWNF